MVGRYDASVVIYEDEQPESALRIHTVDAIKPRKIIYTQCQELETCEHSHRPKAYQGRDTENGLRRG
jgi:hypothetical protein